MTFIEQWLHVDPDGGNGALEALLIGAMVLLIGVRALRPRHSPERRRRR